MAKETEQLHHKVMLGVELEGYTISTPDYAISRKMAFHRKGTSEKGEKFSRDSSIGTEYNSRPFNTIREGFFLLKAGLRKYNTSLYRSKSRSRKGRQIFLVGGWRDRFAGAHIHISITDQKLKIDEAKSLASHIHDHIPLIIAMSANSPVWGDEITENASNRVLKGSKAYFRPIFSKGLRKREFDEMTYSRGRKTKPPTLEIRVMDSNIPEFTIAAACIVKACALGWLRRRARSNEVSHFSYLRSRLNAAKKGMKAKLCWNGRWMEAGEYLDTFIWTYRKELKEMDIPYEIWDTMKLLKREINASLILQMAARKEYRKHPPTWQRRLAKKYVRAANRLLSGDSLKEFMHRLELRMPNLSNVSLGRKKLKLL